MYKFQACKVRIIDLGTDSDNPSKVRNISFTFDVETRKLLESHNQEQQTEFEYLKNGYWTMTSNSRYPQSKEERKEIWKTAKRHHSMQYDFVNFNCKHFVLLMLTGEGGAKQVKEPLPMQQNVSQQNFRCYRDSVF